MNVLVRLIVAVGFFFILFVPAWWLAGRFQENKSHPFFRLLTAVGVALIGYVSFVNLAGRLVARSIEPVVVYLALNLAVGIYLWIRRPRDVRFVAPVLSSWRSWIGPLLIAIVLGLPQWLLAVSTPFWDEVASS